MSARAVAALLGLLAVLGNPPVQAQDADPSPPNAAEPAASAASAAEPAPASTGVPRLRVEAPGPVRTLLERHLDLARAIALPEAATLSEAEWSRLIGSSPAQARTLVQPLGYFNAQASVRREDGPPTTVWLQVAPGEQARVNRLTFEVEGELAERSGRGEPEALALQAALLQAWPLGTGQPFANSVWADAKSAVLARLRAAGYAAASWAGTAAEVNAELSGVRLFTVADSGPLYRAGSTEVSGLQFHDAERVRALAPFGTGAPLTEASLLAYQDRLQKTGLFESVSVSLDPDPAQAEQARVLVQVREAPRQAATVALGYSANTGPRVTLEHVQRRLLGAPLTLRNKLLWGAAQQSWDGELSTHPGVDVQRWSLGGTIDREVGDTDTVLSQRLRVGRSTERHGIERFAYLEAERAHECANGVSGSACDNLNALSGHLDLTLRRLDHALLPTRGYTAQLGLGLGMTDGNASARGGFGRLYLRLTGYHPLGDAWHGEARLELGQVLMRSDVQAPDSQRFRAGGDDSVRGYAYRSLAPTRADGSLTGGRVLATASAEVARPVSASLPSVWWAAFVDAGRATDSWRGFQPALGYGLGLRWRSPVGPLKLDLAYGQELRKVRVHVSVGIAF